MTLAQALSSFATHIGNRLSQLRDAIDAKFGNLQALPTTNKDVTGSITELYGIATGDVNTSRLRGLIDPANMPVQKILGVYKSTALTIQTLSVADQAQLTTNGANNTFNGLRLGGGEVFIYDGGSKTDPMSYTPIADHSPSWDLVEDKPTSFPSSINDVTGLPNALDGKVDKTVTGDLDTLDMIGAFNTALA